MQSTPGDRQPLEDEGLKAGQHWKALAGGGLSATSYATLPHQTYIQGLALKRKKKKKKKATWLAGWLCVSGIGFSTGDERQQRDSKHEEV